ncbi:PREDICTED: L10-interacting MYB domain-containing protein-like [Camelina sativa]|uniref:L10-interacting MYB domain-containing protein-like n=1 Tax=Camelina sativa TaxID=90675 RepID=A0ABM0XSK4_CAMSA|nr:PREDICTED: L10-interacting MYB domain-containing protein-like [Camelina sativa]
MTSGAAWEPVHHRVFVDLCVVQKISGNPPRMQQILEVFQETTGTRFTVDELINHWDTMVKQWKIWCKLVQSRDMKWDSLTNTFGASDQEWANYLQVNPEAEQYRCNPPLFLKKLDVIFEGTNLDGEGNSNRSQGCEHLDKVNDAGVEAILTASNILDRRRHRRTKWTSSAHAIFVNLCYQEYLKGRRPVKYAGVYPKETWNMMQETINRSAKGVGYTVVQIKRHWDVTRRTWKQWCQTIDSPIMKWDANTRTFGATHEDWNTYLKVNKNDIAKAFRRKNIPHADKLATIFKGDVEPKKVKSARRVIDHQSESSQIHQEPVPSSTVVIYTNEPVITGREDRAEGDDENDEPTELLSRSDSEDEDVESVNPGSQSFNTEPMEEKSPVTASVKKKEYTMEECMECLDAMEEVEKGSDLYMSALNLFLTEEYRQIFLLLGNPSLRMSWLLRR